MDITWPLVHLSSWSRIKLGWLDEEKIETVRVGQFGVLEIEPLERPTENLQVLRLPITESLYYLVELRWRIGFDQILPSEGIIVYFINETRRTTECPVLVMHSTIPRDRIQNIFDLDSAPFLLGHEFVDKANSVRLLVTDHLGENGASIIIDRSGAPFLTIDTGFPGVFLRLGGKTYSTGEDGKLRTFLLPGSYGLKLESVVSPYRVEGSRLLFEQWSDGTTNTTRVLTMTTDVALKAAHRLQHMVTVETPYGQASGAGWYDNSSKALISVPETAEIGKAVRVRFDGWTGDLRSGEEVNSLEFIVNKPTKLTAAFKKQ